MAIGIYKSAEAPTDELPHPPIPLPLFLVVEQAIEKAWELMVTNPQANFDLATAPEDAITFELHRRLKDEVLKRRMVPGFDREVLADIVREPKYCSFDRSSIDKMPDLVVLFVSDKRPTCLLPSQDAIFIECKPVDVDHGTGTHYCSKGIARFVRGEYAWAMTSALMVGYRRPGYTILPKLHDALIAHAASITTTIFPTACSQSRATALAEVVCVTKHARSFKYIETKRLAPVIVLRHLWLARN